MVIDGGWILIYLCVRARGVVCHSLRAVRPKDEKSDVLFTFSSRLPELSCRGEAELLVHVSFAPFK